MIPAETKPLAKAIRTTEGVLVIVSDAALAVSALPSLHVLNPRVAAICVAAQHVALIAQRGVVKAKALHVDVVAQKAFDNAVELVTGTPAELPGETLVSGEAHMSAGTER